MTTEPVQHKAGKMNNHSYFFYSTEADKKIHNPEDVSSGFFYAKGS